VIAVEVHYLQVIARSRPGEEFQNSQLLTFETNFEENTTAALRWTSNCTTAVRKFARRTIE
jgi:hypothetical protein